MATKRAPIRVEITVIVSPITTATTTQQQIQPWTKRIDITEDKRKYKKINQTSKQKQTNKQKTRRLRNISS